MAYGAETNPLSTGRLFCSQMRNASRIQANAGWGQLQASRCCSFSVIASVKCKALLCMYAERVVYSLKPTFLTLQQAASLSW